MSTLTTPAGRAVDTEPVAGRDGPAEPAEPLDRADSDRDTTGTGPAGGPGHDRGPVRLALLGRLTPRLVWTLAALVAAAAVGLGATEGRQWYQARQVEQANAEALAAARQLAVNFVTVDHTRIDADIARVRAGAAGEFLRSYTASVTELRSLLVANRTVSRVERSEVALVSGDLDSAVALVGVVAPTTNTAVPRGETKTYRMRLQLRKVDDTWKVENLEFVG